MTSLNSTLHNWRDELYKRLPGSLRNAFKSSARTQLLKQVDTLLMVHDDRLYDLSSGSWRQFSAEPGPEVLARCAREVLDNEPAFRSILLLLPSVDFIATTVNLPGVARENLRSALHLQAAVLLPSYDRSLSFAVNANLKTAEGPDVVLWTDEEKLNALFEAFASVGLFLTAVMPRALAAADRFRHATAVHIRDSDAATVTQLIYQDELLTKWLQTDRIDLEDEALLAQWENATAALQADAGAIVTLAQPSDWFDLPATIGADQEYCFLPAGAQAARRQMERGKRLMLAGVAVLAAVFLASTPFLLQFLQTRSLLANLEELRELSTEARTDQGVVRDFEQRWGVLTEFPRQNIPDALLQLQSVLNPAVLSSLEIVEGSVQIEGESEDPQSLLQRLEQDPMFAGVDFARATNNNRYYIDLRLSTVDFDGYRQRYFPEERP